MADAPYDLCACPSCGTEFRVTAADLAVVDGQVRCGACMAVFDGRAQRVASAALTETAATTALASADDPEIEHAGASEPTLAEPQVEPFVVQPENAADDDVRADQRLARVQRHRRRARRPRIGWRLVGVVAFGTALGANALALQLHARPPDLAAFEVAAPLAERTESPAGFAVTGRLVNRTGLPQRLPGLLVRLHRNGATVGEARFRPGEYLAGPASKTLPNKLLGGMLANESAAVAVRVADADGTATEATLTLVWPP